MQRTDLKNVIRQRGVVAVETVIVLPFMLLLMFAIGEIGRAFYQYNTLTKAVRDGVRYLATNAEVGSTGVIDITREFPAGSGITLAQGTQNLVVYGNVNGGTDPLLDGFTTSDVSPQVHTDDEHLVVNATYDFTPLFGDSLPTFGATDQDISLTLTLRASTTMRAL